MAGRYLAVRLGTSFYCSVITEEVSGGIRVCEKRKVLVNKENLSENGIDREALKSLLMDVSVRDYIVLLPHRDVITGIMEFPVTDRKKIDNSLRFELENEVMDSADAIVYDYSIVNKVGSRTHVAYYSAKKDRIGALLLELQMMGVDPVCLVCPQNVYSGIFRLIFDKKAGRGVRLIADLTDNILNLSFVDNLGYSVGRSLIISDLEERDVLIRNFVLITLKYYRSRVLKEILGTYLVTDDENYDLLMEIFSSETGLGDVNRLVLRDSELNEIEPEFVLPFAAALGKAELTRNQLINFRKGEFVYRGEYEYLKAQIVKYGISILIILLLSISLVVYKFRAISRYEEELNSSLAGVTQQILGKPYDNFTTALAVIKGKTEPKNLSIPRTSAFDYFMMFSEAFPSEVSVDIRVLEIGDKKIRMEGETDSFESVDRVVNGLKRNSCLKDIAKGKVKKSPDGKKIDFDIAITPSC